MEATAAPTQRAADKQVFPLYMCAFGSQSPQPEDFNASQVFIHANFIRDTPLERCGRWAGHWLKESGLSLKHGVR